MVTTVVNLRGNKYDVYIGRKGRGWSGYFGNPHRRKHGEKPGQTLARFEAYFLDRIEKDAEFTSRVLGLAGKRLGCFCKPNPCHGDVIAKWVNSAMKHAEWLTCAGQGCDEAWLGIQKHHVCDWCNGGPFCSPCGSIRNHQPCSSEFYP